MDAIALLREKVWKSYPVSKSRKTKSNSILVSPNLKALFGTFVTSTDTAWLLFGLRTTASVPQYANGGQYNKNAKSNSYANSCTRPWAQPAGMFCGR
jgi:hypothetical protein